jgi:DNA repair exonuclease SbcCD nuclease subunit
MVSFLHSADLHLGLRLTRFPSEVIKKVRERRLAALDRVLNAAKERRVDFIVIAGDLFDDHGIDGSTVRRTFDMLESAPVDVYVLPGNHDPLLPGGIWDRNPWNQESARRVHLLREARPLAIDGAILFPCPVLRKTSLDDPTEWIKGAASALGVRIGIAHGSLRTRDDLPPDDHLIARDTATVLNLDYLALGHWHRQQRFADARGVERTAYSGVHEPMRFQGATENRTGWVDYSGDRQEFMDDGLGQVLVVRLAQPGEPPVIESVEVGCSTWVEEHRELRSLQDLETLIGDVAMRPDPDRQLLRLRVSGLVNAEGMQKLEDLKEILSGRYFWGELDQTGLFMAPTDEQIEELVGHGVLRRVMEKLQVETKQGDPQACLVAQRALSLLYQLAHESQG